MSKFPPLKDWVLSVRSFLQFEFGVGCCSAWVWFGSVIGSIWFALNICMKGHSQSHISTNVRNPCKAFLQCVFLLNFSLSLNYAYLLININAMIP